jgi:hypothetical protein
VRIYDLNPAYLRSEAARRLAARAQELLERSIRGAGDPWEGVRTAAVQMGLWR